MYLINTAFIFSVFVDGFFFSFFFVFSLVYVSIFHIAVCLHHYSLSKNLDLLIICNGRELGLLRMYLLLKLGKGNR